jgi:hypothetical protein
VQALTDVASAMCGGWACVAVTEGKRVFAWGNSDYGGTAPTEVQALTDAATAMCEYHACVAVKYST